jgi:HEAT repeat protein
MASLTIIAAVGMGLTTRQLALSLLILVVGWLLAIMSTRRQYVEQFRARLRHGVIDTRLELEELDRHSLDVLLSALNSDQDAEVLAAIDIFDRHGRTDSMPVLLLYHPSVDVRIRALEAFAEASDLRFISVARRMLSDEEPDIRAAALRALTAADPNRRLLEEKLDLEASIVRATALVGLLGMNDGKGDRGEVSAAKLDEWIAGGNSQTQSSLARAIRHEGGSVFHETLIKLIATDDDSVRLETLRAMKGNPDPRYLPHLLPLLGSSDLRAHARQAVLAIGPDALAALEEALANTSTPRKVRRRIPHTIILFDPQNAADILLRQLAMEREGGLRLRILRALGRLQASHPSTVLDDKLLEEQLRESLLRVVQLLQWHSAIEHDGIAETPDAELLRVALQDKERATLERAFLLMGLRHPEENFALVWRGVTSENARLQAASREVLEATLPGSFREAVLAIVDDGEPAARRARVAAVALGTAMGSTSHQEAVAEMMEDQSEVIRGIATHHAAEIGRGPASAAAQEVQSLV